MTHNERNEEKQTKEGGMISERFTGWLLVAVFLLTAANALLLALQVVGGAQ